MRNGVFARSRGTKNAVMKLGKYSRRITLQSDYTISGTL